MEITFSSHRSRRTRFLWAVLPLLLGTFSLRSPAAILYVSEGTRVGTYDSQTGAAVSPNLITGLANVNGLALGGDNVYLSHYSNHDRGDPRSSLCRWERPPRGDRPARQYALSVPHSGGLCRYSRRDHP